MSDCFPSQTGLYTILLTYSCLTQSDIIYQSSNPDNLVFGLVRNKATAKDAIALEQTHPNLHILQADITDFEALKVSRRDCPCEQRA